MIENLLIFGAGLIAGYCICWFTVYKDAVNMYEEATAIYAATIKKNEETIKKNNELLRILDTIRKRAAQ